MNISAINFRPKAFKCSFGDLYNCYVRKVASDEYIETNNEGDTFIRSTKDSTNPIVYTLSSNEHIEEDSDGHKFVCAMVDSSSSSSDDDDWDDLIPNSYKEKNVDDTPWFAIDEYTAKESTKPYFP